jgi:hypothetical protein
MKILEEILKEAINNPDHNQKNKPLEFNFESDITLYNTDADSTYFLLGETI